MGRQSGKPSGTESKSRSERATPDSGGGRSQSGLRNFNERVILSLVRRNGALPKAAIAAETGLSAQAVTVIINKLEEEGLLIRQAPQRGRVGQPSVPFALNPSGAYAYGLKVGRRSYDLTLLDLTGNILGSLHENCPYPSVDQMLRFLNKGLNALTPPSTTGTPVRLAGIGVAMPGELWTWCEEMGAPAVVMSQWRHFDMKSSLARISSLPVYVCNDDTAACASELLFGNPAKFQDFLYIYIGSFVGGGVVIDSKLYPGRRGNAGALASMPVPVLRTDGSPGSEQLFLHASIRVLENKLEESGRDSKVVSGSYDYWGDLGPVLDDWIEEVAEALAHSVTSAMSIIDFEAAIVDGHIPVPVRHRIVESLQEKMKTQDLRGLSPIMVTEGTIGTRAQSIGSASLPFLVQLGEDLQLVF